MPYQGDAAAFWLLLGPAVELRRTGYDVEAAAEAIRATGYPLADELVQESFLEPVDADWVTDFFEQMAERRGERG